MDRDFDIVYEAYLDTYKYVEEKVAEYHIARDKCAYAHAKMVCIDKITHDEA